MSQYPAPFPIRPFSQFANAGALAAGDQLIGLRNGINSRFTAPAPYLIRQITQAAHGFIVGNVVRLNGANCVKAQADNAANSNAIGVVAAITSVNEFTLLFGGYINVLAGLIAGSVYYLDPVTAGAMTTVAPVGAGQIRKILLIADSATSGYWLNYNGIQL